MNKKEQLLDIAYELFISKGYENTSIDEIISRIGIAKGTFYYYFMSKEQLLESIIDRITERSTREAKEIVDSDLPLVQKFFGVIDSFRPKYDENEIKNALHRKENIVLHKKTNDKLVDASLPFLKRLVEEGNRIGMFNCQNIEEKVRMILIISNELFEDENYRESHIPVFIDTIEYLLGTEKGTLHFIERVLRRS